MHFYIVINFLSPKVFGFARILQEQDALLCKHTFTYASLTLRMIINKGP